MSGFPSLEKRTQHSGMVVGLGRGEGDGALNSLSLMRVGEYTKGGGARSSPRL